jgi:hypothetical protein
MKRVKDLIENYNLISEKDESDTRKLASLVRAGLFDAKKLPLIKRAMDKEPSEMTISERKILLQLLDELMSHVLHSQQVYSKVKMDVSKKDLNEETKDYLSKVDPRYSKMPSEKDIPMVLLLKRKAIRMYPDRQKVALYYSQALDKYFSIPFNEVNVGINEAFKIDLKAKKDDDDDPLTKKLQQKKDRAERDEKLLKLSRKELSDVPGAHKEATGAALRKAGSEAKKGNAGSAAHALGWAAGNAIRNAIDKHKNKNKKTSDEPIEGQFKDVTHKAEFLPPSKSKPQLTHNKTIDVKPNKPALSAPVPKLPAPQKDTSTEVKPEKTKKIIKPKAPKATETTATTPAPAPAPATKREIRPRQLAIKQKFRASLREDFAAKLQQKRMLKEYSAADAVDDATDVLVPYKSAYKNFKAGNYGHAALDAAIDTVGLAASIPSGGSSLAASTAAKTAIKGGVKAGEKLAVKAGEKAAAKEGEKAVVKAGEKEAVKDVEKAAAKEGESAAAKEGEKTAAKAGEKAAPKAGNSRFSKLRTAAKVGAAALGAAMGGAGGKKGSDDDSTKTTEPGKFTLQAKTSHDSDIRTDAARAERERQKLYKEAFSVNLKNKNSTPAPAAPAPKAKEPEKPAPSDDDHKPEARSQEPTKEPKYTEAGQFKMQVKTSSAASRGGTDAARAEKERQTMYRESTIDQLKKMKKSGIHEEVINIGNDTFVINNTIANKVIAVYEALNRDNKKRADLMLNESVDTFKKFINFTVRQ